MRRGAMAWVAVVLAGACGSRSARLETVPAPARPPSISVAPLAVRGLVTPTRGIVLGAGGPGRGSPVLLTGRASTVELALAPTLPRSPVVSVTVAPTSSAGAGARLPAGP